MSGHRKWYVCNKQAATGGTGAFLCNGRYVLEIAMTCGSGIGQACCRNDLHKVYLNLRAGKISVASVV